MKTKILFTALFLALAFFTVRNTNAQPGTLDNTFGTGGKVTTDFGSGDDEGFSVRLQADGKILVAGYADNGPNYDFAIVRYNTDGSLDNTFGTGGKVTTDFGSSEDYGHSVVLQSDGKIIVASRSYNGSDFDFAIVRYNSNGSLDNSFGTGGKVTTAIGSGYDYGFPVALQSDGKILVGGESANGSDYDFAIVRYNSDGSLDNSFGTGGKVTTDSGSNNDYGRSLALQSDGKILLAGWVYNVSNFYDDFAIVRYNSDGSLDNTFGIGGMVITVFASGIDEGHSVALQSDGKILVGGFSDTGSNDDFAIVRYNADGSLDNSFGIGGKVTTDSGIGDDGGYSVVLQSDGKILLAGYSGSFLNYDFAIVRYNSDGSLDNTFGTGGKVTTDFGSGMDYGQSAALQSDGKIVVGGYSYLFNYDFAVVRYNGGVSGITEESNDENFNVLILPNPFTASATLVISSPVILSEAKNLSVGFYDLLGRDVSLSLNMTNKGSGEIEIQRGNLPDGMYFYKVSDKEKILATGKIIIQ